MRLKRALMYLVRKQAQQGFIHTLSDDILHGRSGGPLVYEMLHHLVIHPVAYVGHGKVFTKCPGFGFIAFTADDINDLRPPCSCHG